MGALFYSSNPRTYARMRSRYADTPLTVTELPLGDLQLGLAHAGATPQWHQERDGGVLSSGMVLYEGTAGMDALRRLYRDFVRGQVQGSLSGAFTAAIVHDGRLTLITDPAGVSELYVHSSTDGWSCSSVLYFLAAAIPGLTLDDFALLERSFQYSTIDSDTIFREVRKVSALSCCSVALADLAARSGPPVTIAKFATAEPAVADTSAAALIRIMADEFACLDQVCSGFDLSCTGGLDSRLQLAAMLAAGVDRSRIRLVHGVGSSLLTNTKATDKAIVGEIGEKLGIEVVYKDWSDAELSPRQWAEALRTSGEAGLVYGANGRIVQSYIDDASAGRFQVFGYFGELLRLLEWQVATGFAQIDIEQFLEFYLYSNFKGFDPERRRAFLRWMHEKVAACVGGRRRLDPEDIQALYTAYRQSADTAMSRLCSLFGSSHPVLGSQVFLRALSKVPSELKVGSRLMIDMIEQAAPALMEIGIFSHGAIHDHDRAAGRLRLRESAVEKLRRRLSLGLHRFPRLRHAIRSAYLRTFASVLGRAGDLEVEARLKVLGAAAARESGLHDLHLERLAGNPAALIGFAQFVAMFGWARDAARQTETDR